MNSEKISIGFEFALQSMVVESASTFHFLKSMSLRDAATSALKDRLSYDKEQQRNMKFEDYEVWINRAPQTPFFPIGANEEQIRHFEESKLNPPHEPLEETDLDISVEDVVKKFNMSWFTIYKK